MARLNGNRRHRVAGPLAWVATEYARAHVMTGLAWYFLAHTQYRFIELIQISDLVGAYGVSALVALAATAVALAIPVDWLQKCGWWPKGPQAKPGIAVRQSVPTIATAIVLIGLAVCYGVVRRRQAEFTPGPRVALVQGNFTSSLKHDPDSFANIYRVHRRLTGLAVREQPDLIVWPETMFRYPLLEASEGLDDEQLRMMAPGIPPENWDKNAVGELLGDLAAGAVPAPAGLPGSALPRRQGRATNATRAAAKGLGLWASSCSTFCRAWSSTSPAWRSSIT